ncbi:hypothetical protein ACFQJD_08905 [Haloplanus sp. GCM10025708]|uniref:hypothetical protein n=1 Tax=Haloferacaceae TaxID=1644056 RepID=UPI00361DC83B
MSESERDLATAVEEFLSEAERVYDEYDDGYVDADAALSRLGDNISTLRDVYEGEASE